MMPNVLNTQVRSLYPTKVLWNIPHRLPSRGNHNQVDRFNLYFSEKTTTCDQEEKALSQTYTNASSLWLNLRSGQRNAFSPALFSRFSLFRLFPIFQTWKNCSARSHMAPIIKSSPIRTPILKTPINLIIINRKIEETFLCYSKSRMLIDPPS